MPEVAEFVAPDTYDPAVETAAWNGRKTRLRLARPLVRDFELVAEGESIVVNASLDRDGEWTGPEAEHVRDLFSLGHIAGTEEAAERDRQTAAVEATRGVGDPLTDEDGRAIRDDKGRVRRRFLELRSLTGSQMRASRVFRNGLFGDKAVMQASEQTENRGAIKELVDAMARMFGMSGGAFTGADAAGTAQRPDGTNIVKGKS